MILSIFVINSHDALAIVNHSRLLLIIVGKMAVLQRRVSSYRIKRSPALDLFKFHTARCVRGCSEAEVEVS